MKTYRIALAIAAASLFVQSANFARAADFTVTTEQTYNGGWKSTYRDDAPAANLAETTVASLPKGYAPLPTLCDVTGVGGFQVVTGLRKGDPICVGAR